MWAKKEAKVARVVASSVGDARARAEEDLEAAEEGRHKAEAETTHLEVEQTSLLLELKDTKDELTFLNSQAGRDKEAMEEEY